MCWIEQSFLKKVYIYIYIYIYIYNIILINYPFPFLPPQLVHLLLFRDAWTSCSNETYSKTFLKLKSLLLISTILSSPLLSSQILIPVFLVKHTLKTFDYFKNKQKSVSSNVFWYVKICILWEPIQYIIHCHKTQMLKKNFFGQNKWYKKCPTFFFHEPQLITVLLLICNSYMSWSTSFVSLWNCVGFSIFNSVTFLLKFIFLFNKMYGLFEFWTS